MKRSAFLTLCLFPLIAQAPPTGRPSAPPAATDPRDIVLVPPDVKFLEEASLLREGRLAALTGATNSAVVRTETDPNTGMAMFTGMSDMDAEPANALRVYGFPLQPREILYLKLKAEGQKIIMRVIKPATQDPMTAAIRQANSPPTVLRRSRLSVQNTTDKPYLVRVLLYGEAGYKYRLDIERK